MLRELGTPTKALVVLVTLVGLAVGVLPGAARAEKDKKTCASEYPDHLTKAPNGYPFESQTKARSRFVKEASERYSNIKKAKRERNRRGLCPKRGWHININGHLRKSGKGKQSQAEYIGSLTSCEICAEADWGPTLREVWRFNKDF